MSLDGLRAWIGEVERKLGMRTRVFLVLTVIAIGGAGAGIYLAIDARDSAVSESDVQALQERLEARIGEGSVGTATGAGVAQLETELKALQSQVEQLSGEGGGSGKGGGANGASSGEGEGTSEGSSAGTSGEGGGSSPSGNSASRLGELLQQAKEASEKAEGK